MLPTYRHHLRPSSHRRTALPTDPLLLPNRTALPAELAYLRTAHPAAAWQAHANYGALADFWLGVHRSLRAESAAVTRTVDDFRNDPADPAGFGRRLVPQLNTFLQHLDAHHRIEDAAYFPRFRALDPRMVAGFDLLERDHEIIHDALDTSVQSARRLLAALGQADARKAGDGFATDFAALTGLLGRHLADEEELVIPALLEHGERSVS